MVLKRFKPREFRARMPGRLADALERFGRQATTAIELVAGRELGRRLTCAYR
jgi:hypothetical protein